MPSRASLHASIACCASLALLVVASPTAADETPKPSFLRVDEVDAKGQGQVTIEGPLNIDGTIAFGPRVGLLLGQSEGARAGWAPLIGRRVRASGRLQPGTRKRGERFLLRLVGRRPEAIDAEPAPGWRAAAWPEVADRVVVHGLLDARGQVLLSKGVVVDLLLPREATLARCAGERVELTGAILADPDLHEGVRRFTLDSSQARLLDDGSRGLAPALSDVSR